MKLLEVVIYGMMLLGVLSAAKFWLGLKAAGEDVEQAKERILTREAGQSIEERIRGGEKVSVELFTHNTLQYKFGLFEDEIAETSKSGKGYTDADIEDFFNSDLIDEIGHKNWSNFVSTSLTALCILGTFFGLAFGVKSFSLKETDTIISSIESLISGMGFAFWTSIVGIGAALIFGFVDHMISTNALNKLNSFIDMFHKNVMDNETDNAFNEIIRELSGLEDLTPRVTAAVAAMIHDQIADQAQMLSDTCNKMVEKQEETMQKISDEFVGTMQTKLGTHFDRMGEEVRKLSDSYGTLTSGVDNVRGEMDQVSGRLTGMSATLGSCVTSASQITADFNRLMSELDAAQKQTTSLAQRSAQELSDTIDAQTKMLAQSMGDLVDTHTKTANTLVQRQEETFNALTKQQEEAFGALTQEQQEMMAQTGDAQQEVLRKTLGEQRAIVNESTAHQIEMLEAQKKAAEDMSRVANEMAQRAAVAAAATEAQMQAVAQMQERVLQMTELVSAELAKVQKKTRRGLFGLGKRNRDNEREQTL